jgi:ADP-heptose:LPS heptosyltransferase
MREPSPNPYIGYTIRNPGWRFAFGRMDALLGLLIPYRGIEPPSRPKKILLSHSAHMGDLLIASSVLPVLKSAFPDVRIGFLIGSWARPVIEGHPMVDWIHIVDHWRLNRGSGSRREKVKRHRETRAAALAGIRSVGYDTAVELFYYFPNFIGLLWKAGIPVRIGYASAGFGSLLTHPLGWVNVDVHMSDYLMQLLELLPLPEGVAGKGRMRVPEDGRLPDLLRDEAGKGNGYIVFHMGTGARIREWPLREWRALAGKFAGGDLRLVFTGSGEKERREIETVIDGLEGCVNLCGTLDWPGFVAVVRNARLLFGVESVAGHVAAAAGTPYVVVYSGTTNTHHMRPMGNGGIVLKHPVPCDPCYRARGCDTMDCVRNVTAREVFRAGAKALNGPRAGFGAAGKA